MLQPGFFIDNLGLKPHVEGGYYKELYKSTRCLGERPIASTIYYLLKSGQVSRFHRLKSDELWLYHYGSPLRIVQMQEDGSLLAPILGLAVERGERPQVTVPAGVIFGAEVVEPDSFAKNQRIAEPKMAPIIWNTMYNPASFPLIRPVNKTPNVIAGLMWHPEILPIA